MSSLPSDVPLYLHTQAPSVRGANRTFVRDFRIGREAECDVQVKSGVVSRVHAHIRFEQGRWWIEDNGSTNGTYLDGERVGRAPLPSEAELQIGQNGPVFQVEIPGMDEAPSESQTMQVEAPPDGGATVAESAAPLQSGSSSAKGNAAARPDGSVTQYVRYYFEDQDGPAGEHTQRLRQAYQRVHGKQKRKYGKIIGGVLVLCVLLGGYAVWQHLRNEQLAQTAENVFTGMKAQDVLIAQLKRRIEQSGDAPLQEQLAQMERQRQEQQARYVGYVEELGLYRELSAKEQEIYRVARIFGESEFSIPAGFVRKVKDTIENYWQGPARTDLATSLRRAEAQGYTPFIVQTMREHALPPEFFYLALQESRFNTEAVGPETRWGIAKGMWQFIPTTAQQYGLRIGPRADARVVDPQDERHDFEASTRAAARYLQTIYSTKAQASGLLVIASYNWGEHRVVSKLERLPGPQGIPQGALEGIPENPEDRNYWRFLREYSERMPEETKDYVLKIFSAAVIGQNPKLFGFDFENPLQKYMEAPADPQAVS